MPSEHGYLAANTWTSATSSDTVSATSAFVNPQFFPGADSLEVAFTEVTKAAGDAATVDLWLKTRDEDGTVRLVPWQTSVVNFSASSTSEVKGRTLFTNVPAGSWYPALSVTSASTGFTGTALIRYVDASEYVSSA